MQKIPRLAEIKDAQFGETEQKMSWFSFSFQKKRKVSPMLFKEMFLLGKFLF